MEHIMNITHKSGPRKTKPDVLETAVESEDVRRNCLVPLDHDSLYRG